MKKENENWSEYFERLKKDNVVPAFQIINHCQFDNEKEIFKPITDKIVPNIQEERYFVSNYGNIFDNYRTKLIKGSPDKDGYLRVSLSRKKGLGQITVRIHRVELMAFDFNENHKKLQVNHSNGINTENNLENLEWSTPKENSDHAMLYNLHNMYGEKNPLNKLTEDQVCEICKLIESGKYHDTEIAKKFNVSNTTISDIHNCKIWKRISRDYNFKNKSRK